MAAAGKKRQEREINCNRRDGKRQRWRREREGEAADETERAVTVIENAGKT